MRPRLRSLRTAASLAVSNTALLMTAPAWAAGSNMPWEQPLNQILQSVEGPVAKIIAVIQPADPPPTITIFLIAGGMLVGLAGCVNVYE